MTFLPPFPAEPRLHGMDFSIDKPKNPYSVQSLIYCSTSQLSSLSEHGCLLKRSKTQSLHSVFGG